MRAAFPTLILLAAALFPSAEAADADGRFGVKGVGISTCADFVAALEDQTESRYLFAGWLNGYVTAYNQLTPGTFDIAPWQTVSTLADYLRSYCAERPQSSFFEAVGSMANGLAVRKLESYSDPQRISRGEREVIVHGETVRRLQARLDELGHYSGPVDGLFSDVTAEALAAYQRSAGRPATGLPDQQTLHELLM